MLPVGVVETKEWNIRANSQIHEPPSTTGQTHLSICTYDCATQKIPKPKLTVESLIDSSPLVCLEDQFSSNLNLPTCQQTEEIGAKQVSKKWRRSLFQTQTVESDNRHSTGLIKYVANVCRKN